MDGWLDEWMKAGCLKRHFGKQCGDHGERGAPKRKQSIYSTNKFVIMRLHKHSVLALMKFNICSIIAKNRRRTWNSFYAHTHTDMAGERENEGGWRKKIKFVSRLASLRLRWIFRRWSCCRSTPHSTIVYFNFLRKMRTHKALLKEWRGTTKYKRQNTWIYLFCSFTITSLYSGFYQKFHLNQIWVNIASVCIFFTIRQEISVELYLKVGMQAAINTHT